MQAGNTLSGKWDAESCYTEKSKIMSESIQSEALFVRSRPFLGGSLVLSGEYLHPGSTRSVTV